MCMVELEKCIPNSSKGQRLLNTITSNKTSKVMCFALNVI